jgi:hypothetical protein
MSDSIWTQKATNGEGGNFETPPPDNYGAIIVAMFDVGTHDSGFLDKSGNRKFSRYLFLALELNAKDSTGKPFVLLERFAWTMHRDATWRSTVESITGRTFQDGESFDPRSVVGLAVMAQVINESKGTKTYSKIGGLAQFPKGFPAPVQGLRGGAWSALSGDPFPDSVSMWLPRWYGENLKDIAAKSLEATGQTQTQVQVQASPAPATSPVHPVDSAVFGYPDPAPATSPIQNWGQGPGGKMAF